MVLNGCRRRFLSFLLTSECSYLHKLCKNNVQFFLLPSHFITKNFNHSGKFQPIVIDELGSKKSEWKHRIRQSNN